MKLGWETKPIGELCDIIGGGTPSKSNAAFFNGNIPWATVRDMKADWIERTEHSITPEAVKNSATHILPRGTVVIASRVGLGKICRVSHNTAINQDLRGFIPKVPAQLDTQYLFWWFKNVADQIIAAGNGATVQGVTLPFLRSLVIPLPPLEEQRRIVAVLDKAFAGIATAAENAQRNLANARALFESYQAGLFIEAGETVVPLGEMASFRNGLNFTGSSNGEIIRIVGVKDFQNRLWVPDENLAEVQIDGKLSDTDILLEGDILTVRSNGNRELIGRCIVAPAMSAKTSHSGFTIRIRPNAEKVEPNYLCRILKSPQTRKRLVEGGNGANISSLNQQLLGMLPVPVPDKKKQNEIVHRIDAMAAHADNLRVCANKKLSALSELKQSLLQKAFAGELS